MDSRGEEQHGDLMSKVADHRAVLHRIQDGITAVEEKVSRAGAAFGQRLDGIDKAISQAGETSSHRFDELDAKVEHTQTSVLSLRSSGVQILRCLGAFLGNCVDYFRISCAPIGRCTKSS